MKRAAILLLLVVLLSRAACAADLVEDTAFVIDGDTIEIKDECIRLHGIDSPELAQRCTEDGAPLPMRTPPEWRRSAYGQANSKIHWNSAIRQGARRHVRGAVAARVRMTGTVRAGGAEAERLSAVGRSEVGVQC